MSTDSSIPNGDPSPGVAVSTFVQCLFEPSDLVEVRALKEGSKAKQWWWRAERVADHVADLQKLNEKGWNIYAGVAPRKRVGGGKAQDVAIVRALFADLDYCTVEEALARIAQTSLPPPSLIIATGHGVHVYWLLKAPITGAALGGVRRDLDAIGVILDGDPKVKDLPRIMRIPGFVNVKDPALPVSCTIYAVEPERRYALEDFADAIQAGTDRKKERKARRSAVPKRTDRKSALSYKTRLFMSEGAEEGERNDRLFQAACDMNGRGWSQDEATADLVPPAKRCGLDEVEILRTIQSAFERPREPGRSAGGDGVDQPDPRPIFQYEKGKGHEAVAEACRALAEVSGLFERGHKLVRIVGHEVPEEGDETKVEREAGSPIIVHLPAPTLWEMLSRARKWMTYSNRAQELIPIDPPQTVVSAVLARSQWPGVHSLLGIVGHPVLRPDGTILDRAGYDPETGLYLLSRSPVPRIPDHPTREEAILARDLILDVVSEFNFASEADKACWLAAFLTPIARPAFDGPAPMFLADSSMAGGGKSLLCDVISLVATGYKMPRSPYDESDQEIRKRILAHGLAGDSLAMIDNVPNGGSIGWPSLDAALTTSDRWKDRVLGKSENAEVLLKITWFATGNNIDVRADAPRRVLRFRLEPDVENPEEKADFKYPRLLAHVGARRGRYLAAALTMLRGYIVAGRPKQSIATIGSFEDWSDLVQSTVAWVGLPDPGLTLATKDVEANPEAAAHVQLLALWPTVVADGRGITAAELLARITEATEKRFDRVRECILELSPGRNGRLPDARQLGTRFRALKRRWRTLPDGRLAALAQEETKSRTGVARWRVVYRQMQGVEGMHGVPTPAGATDGTSDDEDDRARRSHGASPELPFSAEPAEKTPCTSSTPCSPAYEDGGGDRWDILCRAVTAMEIDGGISPPDCEATLAAAVAACARDEEAK